MGGTRMIISSDNKIVSCTESELFDYYMSRDLCLLYSFEQYKLSCMRHGTEIIQEEEKK